MPSFSVSHRFIPSPKAVRLSSRAWVRKEVFRENCMGTEAGARGTVHARPLETKPHSRVLSAHPRAMPPTGPLGEGGLRHAPRATPICSIPAGPAHRRSSPESHQDPSREHHISSCALKSATSLTETLRSLISARLPTNAHPMGQQRKSVPRQDSESQPAVDPPRLLCGT